MAKNWLSIRVELLHGGGLEMDPPPGRVMLVGPRHTFGDLAEAIDAAFARWDLSHLHLFELPDGRSVGEAGDDDWGLETVDESALRVAETLSEGDVFEYVFDLGDSWTHRCAVESKAVDPLEAYGIVPSKPVPTWGWGWIPDQYGRRTADSDNGE
jgi:hypothetical protein